MAPGAHVPLRFLRTALKKGFFTLRAALTKHTPTAHLRPLVTNPIPARLPPHTTLRQRIQNRWFTTSTPSHLRPSAPKRYIPKTPLTRTLVARTPFTSTLRPSLNGTFGRSTLGGARGFASAAAPAEVVQNVALGMRAFVLAAKKARLASAHESLHHGAPGAYVDFEVAPRIRGGVLGREWVREMREECKEAARGMEVVCGELEKLAGLGELEVSVAGSVVRVRFPGCGRAEVEALCDEVGVGRGVVWEDERWEVPAVEWSGMMQTYAGSEYGGSEVEECFEVDYDGVGVDTPGISPCLTETESEYEGLEGVHRFLQECDSAYARGLRY